MKLTIFTDHPHGTLGNLGAANKLIKKLKKEEPTLEIDWFILEPNDALPVQGMIPKGVNAHLVKHWTDIGNDKNHSGFTKSLQKSNLFCIFPQVQDKKMLLEQINKFNKLLVTCKEYDSLPEENTSHIQLNSGFGKDNLGIFIEEPAKSDFHLSNAKKLMGGAELVSTLFNKNVENFSEETLHLAEQEYLKTHNLFVGYFNDPNKFGRNFISNPINYCYVSILKSLIQNPDKNIDLVARMTKEEYEELQKLVAKESAKHFILNNIRFQEFNAKDNTPLDKDKVSVRLINAYPYHPEVFLCLVRASNRFGGFTGDQSFSDGLGEEKIMLYERMQWKRTLFNNFLQFIAEKLGANSELYQFYELQNRDSFIPPSDILKRLNILLDFITKKEDILIEQTRKLIKAIQEEKNLYNNLSSKLIHLMQSQLLIEESRKGNIETVRELVTKGVDVHIANQSGETALTWAILNRHLDIATLLLDKTNLDPKSRYAKDLLVMALDRGLDTIITQLLRSKGVNIDETDNKGKTLLMWASKAGLLDIVERLLKNNANPDIEDKQGNTALQHAESISPSHKNKTKIIELIKSYQSKDITLDPTHKSIPNLKNHT